MAELATRVRPEPVSIVARAPRRRGRKRDLVPLLYVAPALLFYGAFLIAPWLHSLWISFWEWDGVGRATWVGLGNYVEVFQEPDLRRSVVNAFGFVIFYSIIPISVGLVLAAWVADTTWRGMAFIRTTLFLPQILPLVAVGVIWKMLLADDGPLNDFLQAVGLGGLAKSWLGDFFWAFPAVGFVGAWVSTGLCFLLLLSGIGKIDPSLYEAAELDGCGRLLSFWHITLPGLRSEIGVAATVTVIAALASFDVVYVMTNGGPGDTTIVPGLQVYKLVFQAGRVGTACALATVLSILTCAVMYGIGRLARGRAE